MASRNSQKSISRPSLQRSAIILNMVGFLVSNPRLCIADFSYLGSIFPVAQVSKRLKASLSSSIQSSVSPGRSTFFFPVTPFPTGFLLIQQILNLKLYQINLRQYLLIHQVINLKGSNIFLCLEPQGFYFIFDLYFKYITYISKEFDKNMSKRQLEATQQGKQLLAIEQLSQQLQTYFKDIEHLRRQNFLFESYSMRLQKQFKREEDEEVKPKDKKNQQKKVFSNLTPEQKYEIAQQQAEALKETIEKGRIKSDAILETLRAILEETDMAIAEIKKDAYDFQRQILMGGENSRTGSIEAERIEKFFEEKDRQKRAMIEKYKNKKNTLATQIVKTANSIAKKQQMGDELKFIDFHQLQIQNKKYVKQIDDKNGKLLKFKISSGKIGSELLEAKKKLNEIVSQISRFQKEITEKERNIIQLEKSQKDHEEKRFQLNEKKRNLHTQAEQMISPNNTTDIPDTMAYVLQKRKQQKLLYEKKNLQRKILIANPMFEKAKKALGI